MMEKINFTPDDARAYIAEYVAKFPNYAEIDWIQLIETGEKLPVRNMTDQQAMHAAFEIWKNVDLPFFIHLRSTGQMQ